MHLKATPRTTPNHAPPKKTPPNSFVCDELDGRAARAFDQASTLGALLDMLTDRVATTGLLALLVARYPSCSLVFLSLVALDVSSHWLQMYASALAGAATHKDVASRSALVRLYYRSRVFMGFCCVCCEVLYLALFLLSFPEFQVTGRGSHALPLPPAAVSRLPGWLLAACPAVRRAAAAKALPLAAAVALAALPGVAVKQACNWRQLTAAAAALVEHDAKKLPAAAAAARNGGGRVTRASAAAKRAA